MLLIPRHLSMPNYLTSHLHSSLDAVQPRAIHSYLVINLVRLSNDTVDMFVLRIDFVAHCSAESVQALSRAVELIQVAVLHGISVVWLGCGTRRTPAIRPSALCSRDIY
jgi:hypothetical protein